LFEASLEVCFLLGAEMGRGDQTLVRRLGPDVTPNGLCADSHFALQFQVRAKVIVQQTPGPVERIDSGDQLGSFDTTIEAADSHV
jgi:hypothetical protein